MKLLVLLSSCVVASYAIPLVDYFYKGYEQAPYTVTANYNVMKKIIFLFVFLVSLFRELRQGSIQQPGGHALREEWK